MAAIFPNYAGCSDKDGEISAELEVAGWKPADSPPDGSLNKWTDDVVVITNYGDVFMLAYFNGEYGGCWQRPARFNDGEKVEMWSRAPELE